MLDGRLEGICGGCEGVDKRDDECGHVLTDQLHFCVVQGDVLGRCARGSH